MFSVKTCKENGTTSILKIAVVKISSLKGVK